ncbi:hypothetical protein MKK84_00675 [Methylobacterium sp. E-065]|uniref:hypothetical protein n=1 Tax=Methylobacterium sp. E-065 TaxID=2836583 RepID=UPI001FBA83CA|nr:hypothetical protein [Methylobacterium sp. E-065]MCJ2015954.1 hypothetical protein [Methylobacterium sp. E-065]
MQKKTCAQRGPRQVSMNVASQADTHGNTPAPAFRQDLYLAARYGLSPAVANVIAELALATPEHWRRA